MPAVGLAVMAHPQRSAMVASLITALGPGPVPVAWDQEGSPAGRDPERIWRTSRAAWSLFDPTVAYHLVLQDDAIVSAGLRDSLARALHYVPPGSPVSLYAGAGRPLQGTWSALAKSANDAGASWIAADRLWWGVGIAVPTGVIPSMLAWCDKRSGLADDQRIGGYFMKVGVPAWYMWPSLVDHSPGPSLTGHKDPRRVARRFAPDATRLDWSGPVVTSAPMLRRFPALRGQVVSCTSPGRAAPGTPALR